MSDKGLDFLGIILLDISLKIKIVRAVSKTAMNYLGASPRGISRRSLIGLDATDCIVI
jgi:hypothetical protein